MRVPDEFKAFASLFDLDLHDRIPSENELIAFALKHTPKEHTQVVKAFVDGLLGTGHSDADLQKVWLDAGSGLSIPDQGELRRFLQMIREAMG